MTLCARFYSLIVLQFPVLVYTQISIASMRFHRMQDKSINEFVHIMKCANAFGMPKLLACCGHHIAVYLDTSFEPGPSALLPTWMCSMLRIAGGLREVKPKILAQNFSQSCNCRCCWYDRNTKARGCTCPRPAIEDAEEFNPCPKVFLDMAQQLDCSYSKQVE